MLVAKRAATTALNAPAPPGGPHMRPNTAPGSSSGGGESREGRLKPPKWERTIKDTYKSNVPLKSSLHASLPCSTYSDAYGGLGRDGSVRRSQSAQGNGPIRFKEFTQPFGAVNKVTALGPFQVGFRVLGFCRV